MMKLALLSHNFSFKSPAFSTCDFLGFILFHKATFKAFSFVHWESFCCWFEDTEGLCKFVTLFPVEDIMINDNTIIQDDLQVRATFIFLCSLAFVTLCVTVIISHR